MKSGFFIQPINKLTFAMNVVALKPIQSFKYASSTEKTTQIFFLAELCVNLVLRLLNLSLMAYLKLARVNRENNHGEFYPCDKVNFSRAREIATL